MFFFKKSLTCFVPPDEPEHLRRLHVLLPLEEALAGRIGRVLEGLFQLRLLVRHEGLAGVLLVRRQHQVGTKEGGVLQGQNGVAVGEKVLRDRHVFFLFFEQERHRITDLRRLLKA